MIILDTNVISELMRPTPDPAVVAWVEGRSLASLYTTAVTEAELRYGVAILPAGRRRDGLQRALQSVLDVGFRGRLLGFDSAAAEAYAAIAAARRASGRPIAQLDGLIAGIALSRDAAVATRNVVDFEGCDLTVLDPWG